MQQSSLSQFTKSLSAKFVDILMSSTKKCKDHDRVAYTRRETQSRGGKARVYCKVALTSVTVVPL